LNAHETIIEHPVLCNHCASTRTGCYASRIFPKFCDRKNTRTNMLYHI